MIKSLRGPFLLCLGIVIIIIGLFTMYTQNSEGNSTDFGISVMDVTNDYRSRNNVIQLAYNTTLQEAARIHALDIASLSGHTGSDGSSVGERATRSGYKWSSISENIYMSSWNPDNSDALDGWINSSGHNKNLLRKSSLETGVYKHYHSSAKMWVVVAVYGSSL